LFFSKVRLKHIESLCFLLVELTELDPFAKVDVKYREKLSQEEDLAFSAFFREILSDNERDKLRQVLKQFICNHLTEKTTSSMKPMVEILGYLEVGDSFLVDIPWFESFPASILMSCCLEVYHLMESLS
jgi:hypothetical protein